MAACASQFQCLVCPRLRRQSLGLSPTTLAKTRAKWAWLAKPVATATSAICLWLCSNMAFAMGGWLAADAVKLSLHTPATHGDVFDDTEDDALDHETDDDHHGETRENLVCEEFVAVAEDEPAEPSTR